MIDAFMFSLATEVRFGVGSSDSTGSLARQLGRRAVVITGGTPERAESVVKALRTSGLAVEMLTTASEPTTSSVEDARSDFRRMRGDLVVGFGGGSAIDTAKIVAGLADTTEPLSIYLEGLGSAATPRRSRVPCIAIPTTAGTGAEVTRNAVLTSRSEGVKVSIRGASIAPTLAVVDPALTITMPAHVTAWTGLDALTQLIESYLAPVASPLTDLLAESGIRYVALSLRRAFDAPGDMPAREAMSLASLLGGMVLSNSRLGAVHALAAALGGSLDAPHGALCGRLLPHVLRANFEAGDGDLDGLRARGARLAELVTGRRHCQPSDAVDWIGNLVTQLGTPGLSRHGLTPRSFAAIAAAAQRSNSMKGNPVPLDDAALAAILRQAM